MIQDHTKQRKAAIIIGDWEYHFVGGYLFITSECDPDTQVKLTAVEALDLLSYLSDRCNELVVTAMRLLLLS